MLVAGCGPAGLALAAACAERGLSVTVVAPDAAAPWPQTFGAWYDELEPLGLASVVADRWPAVTVRLRETAPQRLLRSYVRLDNERLRRLLWARALRAGAGVVTDRAARVEHDAGASVVVLASGARSAARVAVDATGHRPVLLQAPPGPPAAFQSAFGLAGVFRPPPIPPGSATLMDYRPAGPADDTDPTFLYAMDLGRGRFLVEETSLARREPLPTELLESRLRARLDALGVRAEGALVTEHVRIPMGGRLPDPGQRVVGYGAAAGMVHPATGYQVAAALSRAPAVAEALARALPHTSPAGASRAAWEAVWPADLRRQRALHELGLAVLLALDGDATRQFFRAFFELPVARWSGYLSGERSAGRLARTMLTVLRRAPLRLRPTIVVATLGGLRALATRPRR